MLSTSKKPVLTVSVKLPTLSAEASQHAIDFKRYFSGIHQDQAIPFSQFMEEALFAPGHGYYSAGAAKLGPGGDFITAPEISPLFSQALAKACHDILTTMPNANILELGPGRGTMAAAIMQKLEQLGTVPEQYCCLERSADLRGRQQQHIQQTMPQHIGRFQWLDTLPQNFNGIIIANEVADCLPAVRFRMHNETILENVVALQDGEFIEKWVTPVTPQLENMVTALPGCPWEDGFTSELMPSLPAWIQSLADCMQQGVLLFMDYGFPAREYYHPQRNMGTLMCHFQHHAHGNPLTHVGCQDITCHVDFTRMAQAGYDAGLELLGYGTQAAFLLNNGLLDYTASIHDPVQAYQQRQAVMRLTSPNEMGEAFKVMAFAKNWDHDFNGFNNFDQSERL